MARTSFTLGFETTAPHINPDAPTPAASNVTVKKLRDPQFEEKIRQGKVTLVGLICQDLDDVTTQDVAADAVYTAGANCVIVYIGGTAYRICS